MSLRDIKQVSVNDIRVPAEHIMGRKIGVSSERPVGTHRALKFSNLQDRFVFTMIQISH